MYLLTLKSGENIRCDGKVFLEMYLKSYGFYNGILVASQTRDEIFLHPNLSVNGEFPSQRPVTRSFGVWFDLYLNKQLSKQSWGWWVEMPSRSLWRHFNEDPLNKSFSQKINVSYVEIRMFRVKWLKTMTSFVASPGHQYPQYCNNVIHSVYTIIKKRSEVLAIESLTSTRLCLMILFRFCSYLCCLSMGGSYNFRLCFGLQNVTPWQNNIVPCIRSWCDEAKM